MLQHEIPGFDVPALDIIGQRPDGIVYGNWNAARRDVRNDDGRHAHAELARGLLSVRRGDVETIEQTRDKGFGITVYLGTRRGHASTSEFSGEALEQTVREGKTITSDLGGSATTDQFTDAIIAKL